jgi:hypothetical protein
MGLPQKYFNKSKACLLNLALLDWVTKASRTGLSAGSEAKKRDWLLTVTPAYVQNWGGGCCQGIAQDLRSHLP